ATAEAEPEDEPPGTRSGAAGLSGVPSNGFSPRMPSDTSSVIVLPISVAPASSSRCTAQAWRVGTGFCRAQSGLPPPVGWPATSKRSLAANVRPASGPFGAPGTRTLGPATKGLVTTGFYAIEPDSLATSWENLMVEGKGFDVTTPRFLENLRDAILRNAAKRGRPRPTASHANDHRPAPQT